MLWIKQLLCSLPLIPSLRSMLSDHSQVLKPWPWCSQEQSDRQTSSASCQLPLLPFWGFYFLSRHHEVVLFSLLISHLCSEMGLKASNLPVSLLFVLYFFFLISHRYMLSCLQTKITAITVFHSLSLEKQGSESQSLK